MDESDLERLARRGAAYERAEAFRASHSIHTAEKRGAADARAGKISNGNTFATVPEQLAYRRGYANPHAQAKRSLIGHIEAQSEAVKIEFRRREDQALAAVSVAGPVWEGIDNETLQLQGLKESRWRKVEGIMFVIGAVISGLHWGSYSVDIGRGLMVIAAFSFGSYLFNTLGLIPSRLAHLERQQELLLLQWLSSGASESCFHEFRILHANTIEHDKNSSNTDEWRARSIELDHTRTRLWLDVRRGLLERAAANLLFGDFDEDESFDEEFPTPEGSSSGS